MLPFLDGLLFSLEGAYHRLLERPPELPKDAAHVSAMMLNAEGALDELSNTAGGPEVAEEAMLLSALLQKRTELLQLLVGELGLLALMRDGQQSVGAMLAGFLEPLAHGSFRHAQSHRDVNLLPAQLLQRPRPFAPLFAPVACLLFSCSAHSS